MGFPYFHFNSSWFVQRVMSKSCTSYTHTHTLYFNFLGVAASKMMKSILSVTCCTHYAPISIIWVCTGGYVTEYTILRLPAFCDANDLRRYRFHRGVLCTDLARDCSLNDGPLKGFNWVSPMLRNNRPGQNQFQGQHWVNLWCESISWRLITYLSRCKEISL